MDQTTGTFVVNVEGGKIKGSHWFLCRNLGLVHVNRTSVSGFQSLDVPIDMTKLLDWIFPTECDPRNPSNLSMWRDGISKFHIC